MLNEEVKSLYQKDQYDRAVAVAKKALDVAEKAVESRHPTVATSLNKPHCATIPRASTRRPRRATSALVITEAQRAQKRGDHAT